jgi:hypothetical protein
MGKQPVRIEDELERAIFRIRARFMSGYDTTATVLASLEKHLVEAPFEQRKSVGAV